MSFKEWVRTIWDNHRWTVVMVLLGLVLFILLVTINFWRTLLLCVVVGICFLIGRLMDRGGWNSVKEFFDRILPK